MRQFVRNLLVRLYRKLSPKPDYESETRSLRNALASIVDLTVEKNTRGEAWERVSELIEARRMAGQGPWRTSETVLQETDRLIAVAESGINNGKGLREALPPAGSIGAYGDIELALQNVEWRREVNLSWLEFSRWGIQQIILISRLYYIKNPLIQRGINVSAQYVFGRGVEVSSADEKANDVLKRFFERNASTLGQVALTDLERRKYYDGNLFFIFFSDTVDKGEVNIRTIDATEIQDIITDPDDTDKPQLYKREWTQRSFNVDNGSVTATSKKGWYPALGYMPAQKPKKINGDDVFWDSAIYHRKCGAVSKWNFGCPLVYAALDWAKAARRFLESCASVNDALAQIAIVMKSKGGQQALMGIKQQLQTSVGPTSNLWDTNPPAGDGSIFASGPGTSIEAFNTKGAGIDPEKVRQYRNMVATVFGIPPTFLADMETSNLATATSLDRPTELNFMEKQEAWREDLMVIAKYVLSVSNGAPSGKLREGRREKMDIREAKRVWKGSAENGRMIMVFEAKPAANVIEVAVNFPAIREGDLPALVTATVLAMTLGNRQGATTGIDEKAGVSKLYDLLNVEDGDELVEQQYPDSEYDPDRTKEPPPELAPKIGSGLPTQPGVEVKPTEAVKLARRLLEAVHEETSNGTAHVHTRG